MKYLSLIILFVNIISIAKAFTNINIYGTGLFLPYSIGVIGYIKKNIVIPDYKITGISGGAWCSLLYTQEDDLSNHDKIWSYTIGDNVTKLKIQGDLKIFQKNVEDNLKLRYNLIFEAFNVKNINELNEAINKIKSQVNLVSDFKKLGINIDKNYGRIIDGTNILRLKNNPIKLDEEDIKHILLKK